MRMVFFVLLAAMLGGCGGPSVTAQTASVWCYRTLADAECYPAPIPDRDTGFLGAFTFMEPEGE
jgi:hypothetical protein